jgi:hypothetical protein
MNSKRIILTSLALATLSCAAVVGSASAQCTNPPPVGGFSASLATSEGGSTTPAGRTGMSFDRLTRALGFQWRAPARATFQTVRRPVAPARARRSW